MCRVYGTLLTQQCTGHHLFCEYFVRVHVGCARRVCARVYVCVGLTLTS